MSQVTKGSEMFKKMKEKVDNVFKKSESEKPTATASELNTSIAEVTEEIENHNGIIKDLKQMLLIRKAELKKVKRYEKHIDKQTVAFLTDCCKETADRAEVMTGIMELKRKLSDLERLANSASK